MSDRSHADRRFDGLEALLAHVLISVLARIEAQEAQLMTDLSQLRTEVAEARTASESAVALIGGLAQQIRDLSTDPAALEELANDLDASTDALAEAVTAASAPETTDEPAPPSEPETPSEPAPPVEPAPGDGDVVVGEDTPKDPGPSGTNPPLGQDPASGFAQGAEPPAPEGDVQG